MSGGLFYTAAIGFLVGVALRTFFDTGLAGVSWVMVGAVVVGLIWRRNSFAISAPYLLTLGLFIFCLALGALRLEMAGWSTLASSLEAAVGTELTLTGTIAREPDVRARTQHLYTKVDNELLLVTTDRFGDFAYGDVIKVTGTLEKPEAFATDLGRTFNYPGYLEAQGVRHKMSFASVEVVERDTGNFVIASLLKFKHAFMEVIETLIPEPQVGLAEGLLLGVKRALGEELSEVFRRTGIIHIVVLSGYNVMLVVTFVMYILSYLLPLRGRLVFGLVAITAFALLVGLSATVVRASIMAALLLIAKSTGRTYALLRALLFAAIVMVVINPYLLIYDPGFQLSFLATLALILLAPYLEAKLTIVPGFIGIREFLVATLATQFFVLPMLLYQIGEFSVVSVLVNVLVLPMVPVAMLLTFITGLVGFVSATAAAPIAWLTTLSLSYILVIATWFADLPFAAFVVPAFSFWWVVLAYGVMAYGLWRYMERQLEPKVSAETSGWTVEEETETGDDSRNESSPVR